MHAPLDLRWQSAALYDALLPSGRLLTAPDVMSNSHDVTYNVSTSASNPPVAIPGLALIAPPPTLDIPAAFRDASAHFAEHFRAPRTIKVYRGSWIRSVELCASVDRCPLPMDVGTAIGVVCEVASTASSLAVPSSTRSAIAFVHKLAKLPDPTKDPEFLRFWSGIVNAIGTDHPNAKWAILADELGMMVRAALQIGTLESFIDACVLILLYEFALRRSELGDALLGDLKFERFVTLEVPTSKTRKHMEVVTLDEARSPVDARALLLRLRELVGRERGPLIPHINPDGTFGDESIADHTMLRIVKRNAALIGIDPEKVGAHSPRAGWATQAILDGKSDAETAAHLRHDSLDTLLEYYRPRRHRRLNLTRVSLQEVS